MATKLNFCPFKKLPERGTPGHLFFVKDSPRGPELLLAARNGVLVPVTELFNLEVTEAPGRDGRDGVDGAPGAPGRDGKDGAKGDKGDPGDITVVGDGELLAAVKKLRAQKAAFMASVIERLAGLPDIPAAKLAKIHLEKLLQEIKAQ